MSPEQARGDKGIDHRSDVWALGVVLYEALSGRTPFHEIEALGSLIIAICSDAPPPVQRFAPWVPPQVAAVVHKALSIDRDARFQSMEEMYRAIKAVVPGGSHFVSRSMLVPLTEEARAHVAPSMTSAEPALSASGPGAYDDGGANRGASISGERALPVAATPSAAAGSSPAGPAPTTTPTTDRVRTTAGVAREAASSPSRSKLSVTLGALGALGAVALGVLGARVASTKTAPTPPPAAAPASTLPSEGVAERVAPIATPTPTTPSVAPAPNPTAAATVAPTPTVPLGKADAGAPVVSTPRTFKPPTPTRAAPTPAPATTNIGGRIIRTDLP
jgi:serine/threonine-protein kinase